MKKSSLFGINYFFILLFVFVPFLTSAQTDDPFRNTDSVVQKEFGKIVRGTSQDSLVQRVGKNIVKFNYATDYKIAFKLVQSDEINAFAYGDGNIYVMTGLFKTLSSEADLAFVMGHEIAHIVMRHYHRTKDLLDTSTAVVSDDQLRAFTRDQEFEADQYGVLYAIRAGYSPLGSVNWFNAMTNLGYEFPPKHVDNYDHPNFTQRVVQAFINIASYYEYAKHFDYGVIYLSTGEYPEAIESFKKFLDKYPHYKEAYNNIGVALLAQKLEQKSVNMDLWMSAAVSRVQLFPGNFDKRVRGKYLVTETDFKEAANNFKKALEYDPNFVQPYVNIALVSAITGDYLKAKKNIETALRLDKKNSDALMVAGFIASEQSNFKEAIDVFQKAYYNNLKDPKSLFNLAYAYQWNKQKDDAIKTWGSFLKMVPDGYYAEIANNNLAALKGESREKKPEDQPYVSELNKTLILSGIKLNDTKDAVLKKINAPASKETYDDKSENWNYYNPDIRVSFSAEGKVIMVVLQNGKSSGLVMKDKRAVKVGETADVLEELFGSPVQISEDGIYQVYDYSDDGFAFYVDEEGIIAGIAIYSL